LGVVTLLSVSIAAVDHHCLHAKVAAAGIACVHMGGGDDDDGHCDIIVLIHATSAAGLG
jgi:hypothetical protein